MPGYGDGQFNTINGIAIGKSGYVYVVDSFNNRIQKFDSNGGFIKKWGTNGTARGEFKIPTDISIDKSGNQEKVKVSGVLRIFLEHIYETTGQPDLPHIFEIHPVRKVVISDNNELSNITMDCPDKGNFRKNNSVHKIELQDDGTMLKDGRKLQDDIQIQFDGTNLTFINPPSLNVNYVYTYAYFSKTTEREFPDGKPYLFELKNSSDADSIGIPSIAIPDTPAYNILKEFHNNPSGEVFTAVVLRSLNISNLMNSIYDIMFCPVYRIEQNGHE